MPAAYIPKPGTCSSSSLWRMEKGAMSGGGGTEAGVPLSSDMSDSDPELPDPRGTGRVDAAAVIRSASGGMGVVGLIGGSCAVPGGGYPSPRP